MHPSVVILAGPNGAGKSTAAPALVHGALAVDEFVNADVIARWLSAFDPEGEIDLLFLWLPSAAFAVVSGRPAQLLQPVRATRVDLEAVRQFRPRAQVGRRAFGFTAAEGLR